MISFLLLFYFNFIFIFSSFFNYFNCRNNMSFTNFNQTYSLSSSTSCFNLFHW